MRSWLSIVVGFLMGSLLGDVAIAQVVADPSLGLESSIINIEPGQNDGATYIITGGAARGANLFHSFNQFSIMADDVAVFENAATVENIIARVTGSSLSNLGGRIQAIGDANLFLLNPAGIVVGENASLEIGGSFFASTGQGISFGNGFTYRADTPEVPPLLTISTPVGLAIEAAANNRSPMNGIFDTDVGNIRIAGQGGTTQSGFGVNPGQTLAFVGREISLSGARLRAPGGYLELASIHGDGVVKLSPTSQGFDLEFDEISDFGDIRLFNQSIIDVTGNGGGTIELQGETITLEEQSALVSDTLGDTDGGRIDIVADRFSLQDNSFIGAATLGNGRGSHVEITAKHQIDLMGPDVLNFKLLTELFTLQGNRQLLVRSGGISTGTNAAGQSGDIRLNTQRLLLENGSVISADTLGVGNGGNIQVNATDQVHLAGSGILTNSLVPGIALLDGLGTATGQSAAGIPAGNAGNVTVNTDRLHLDNGASITSVTLSDGDAGNVLIDATEAIELTGFFEPVPIPTSIATITLGGTGTAGNIHLDTGQLNIQDGSLIISSSGGLAFVGEIRTGGPAGSIHIDADQSVEITGSYQVTGPLLSNTLVSSLDSHTRTEFSAGAIELSTPALVLADGGRITSITLGSATGGSLMIMAEDVLISGAATTEADSTVSGIFSSSGGSSESLLRIEPSAMEASGQAGTVDLRTQNLIVQNQGAILLDSFGTGTAGDLNIVANDIQLARQGRLTARTVSGQGGNINLTVDTLLQLNQQGEISATAEGNGNGGNITVNGGLILAGLNQNSDIIANAVAGQGGRILLATEGLLGFESSRGLTTERLRGNQTNDISASSEFGLSGQVQIFTQIVDPIQGLAELPIEPLDGRELMGQSICAVEQGSAFIVSGRGGVPLSPGDVLNSAVVWGDERQTNWVQDLVQLADRGEGEFESNSTQTSTASLTAPLVEAQGVNRLSDGRIALVAPPLSTETTSPLTCHGIHRRLGDG